MSKTKLNNRPWAKEELSSAAAICKQSRTYEEACAKISAKVRQVTADNLCGIFRSRGMSSPQEMFVVDPVERQQHVEDESRLKREHKELVERLREAEERQHVLDRLDKPVKITAIKRRERSGTSAKREGCAVILASDWHIESLIPNRPDTAGNYFDLKVAEKRVNRFFVGIRDLIDMNRPIFGIRDVILWLGGDLINGYLRNENREENQLSPAEAITWLKVKLSAGIDYLLTDDKIETITIPCSHGNHGRTTEKRQISTGAKNSFEWLLYQWLADRYSTNKRVRFVTDQSNHQYVEVYDFTLHFTHGDEVKYQGGIGGIAVPLMKAVAGWDRVRPSTVHNIGHFHQLTQFSNATVNGSICGFDQYAMSIRANPEPAQQAFYIMDSKRGKTANFPIWCVGDDEVVG